MKQRDLEALAARYFAAPEADEALLAEEARMCATLPEAWRAELRELPQGTPSDASASC